MKVFISGKITDNPNYKQEFNIVEAQLKQMGFKVMNPAILPEGFNWKDYMAICKEMLMSCEVVVFLPNYKDSRGARQELRWAEKYNLKKLYAINIVPLQVSKEDKYEIHIKTSSTRFIKTLDTEPNL